MRQNSQVLIYLDVPKAMAAGLKFELSANGVVLTEGDGSGFVKPEFFERVEFTGASAVGGGGAEGAEAGSRGGRGGGRGRGRGRGRGQAKQSAADAPTGNDTNSES